MSRLGSRRWRAPRSWTTTVALGNAAAMSPTPPAWSRWMWVTMIQRRSVGAEPGVASARRAPLPTLLCEPVSTSAGCGPSTRNPAVIRSMPPSRVSIWRMPGAISSTSVSLYNALAVGAACELRASGWARAGRRRRGGRLVCRSAVSWAVSALTMSSSLPKVVKSPFCSAACGVLLVGEQVVEQRQLLAGEVRWSTAVWSWCPASSWCRGVVAEPRPGIGWVVLNSVCSACTNDGPWATLFWVPTMTSCSCGNAVPPALPDAST